MSRISDSDLDVFPPDALTTPGTEKLTETHRAFIDGIEVCAERFPNDEEQRVSCFAEVVRTTIGKRPSKRTGTAIPADTTESRRRGSAHAHAALRAKRAAQKAKAEAEALARAQAEEEAARSSA
ncbi:MAG: hypothetical protein U0031_07280 [Thermomicrobiales bacterium]